MTMAHKYRLRYRPSLSSPKGNSTAFPIYPVFRKPVPVYGREIGTCLKKKLMEDERPRVRFVRVEDRLFKVHERFFLQMPPDMPTFTTFRAGRGSTPEKPILIGGHSSAQFQQLLTAFDSYPSLDPRALTLDHILTIGELSCNYHMHDLARWFLPVFYNLVTSHDTPLRKSSNCIFIRMMKLAMVYRQLDLLISITAKWVSRLYWRELDPLSAVLFADVYGMRDLLGHACYVYLMSAERRIRDSQEIDPKGLLSPRQKTNILSGYYSLGAYWKHLRRTPLEFTPAPECQEHSRCVAVWKVRWAAAMEKECPLADADVLARLVFVEQCLRDDMLLGVCLSFGCKVSALKAVSAKRDWVSKQLHHYFDL
ncbi:hypothetical protein GALMADRAFT_1349243 [Galerina marginata CBS 339.88]|uniref:BTB domain-containing protein n=1 Tax=Galerina marginata (strain CBS 339.88) TaxID=685588 RepID=A0A067TL59_GALM3|nr:hypothetical protein GALMADRAFT_1349243 [Galerina marginata CBS 339.88]